MRIRSLRYLKSAIRILIKKETSLFSVSLLKVYSDVKVLFFVKENLFLYTKSNNTIKNTFLTSSTHIVRISAVLIN